MLRHLTLHSVLLFALTASLASRLPAQNAPANVPAYLAPQPHYVQPTGFTYGAWRSCVLGSGGYLQHVVSCPTNAQRFYMSSDVGGLYRSDDGGQKWRMLHGNLPARSGNYEVRGLLVDPRDDRKVVIATGSQYGEPEGIYLSNDAGQSWTRTLTARFVGNGGARWTGRVLARSPQNPEVLLCAGVGDGVWQSRDNGATWQERGGKELYPNDILIDRADPQRWWLCTGSGKIKGQEYQSGFYRTENGGATWTKLEGAAPSELVQDPKDAGALFGIFQNAFLKKSTDNGASWQDFSDGLPTEAPAAGQSKPSISKTTYRALTAGPDFLLTCNTRDADFFKLPTGATQWQKVAREKVVVGDWYGANNNWYFGGAAGSITVDVNDAAHWFVTDYGAVWQTRDAGKNWRLTIDGVEMTVGHCLTQDPTDAGVLHAGFADVGAFHSTDGGERFLKGKVLNAGDGGGNMKCIDLSPKLPNRLYAVGNYRAEWAANQVYISIDRGQSWQRSPMAGLPDMGTQRCTTIVADPDDPYTVYLTVSGTIRPDWGGVYQSTDGGATWTWMSDGLPTGKYFFPSDIWAHGRQLAARPGGALVAISQGDNLVYRFDPKTQKWSNAGLRAKSGKLWSVVADPHTPSRFFIGAQGDGLYRSEDDGATWQKIYDKSVYNVAVDGAVMDRVAAGTSDGVILSTDGGATWTETDKSLPYKVGDLVAFAGERLYAGSGGSGVFWMPISGAGKVDAWARTVVVAAVPPAKGALPALVNLDFEAEGTPVPGWKLATTAGAATLERSNKAARGPGFGLWLNAQPNTIGTLSQEFVPTTGLLQLSGSWWPRGDWKSLRVELQALDADGKTLATTIVGSIKGDKKWWEGFAQAVGLPQQTARCRLSVVFEGEGNISLDGFGFSQPEPLFLERKLTPRARQ